MQLRAFLAANEENRAARAAAKKEEQAQEQRFMRDYARKLDAEEQARHHSS